MSLEKKMSLGVKGKQGGARGFFQYPIGCAVSRDEEYLICDHGNNRVQLFDVNGRLKTMMGMGVLDRPSAVVCASNGAVAVRADNGLFVRHSSFTTSPLSL